MENQLLLNVLAEGVQENEKRSGKKHQVFRLSFDARLCHSERMIEQKLDYLPVRQAGIHHNPVNGKWSLAADFAEYHHSSATYYELGIENQYVTHYKKLDGEV